MHYTTNGTEIADQSSVGLIFAKRRPAHRVLRLQLTNDHFVIPPGVDNFRVEARGTLPNDATLLSFFPHMHLRGKRFEYNIVKHRTGEQSRGAGHNGASDMEIETLLRVHYHFHWQMSYRLAGPPLLEAGARAPTSVAEGNSRRHAHPPDPNA